MTNLPPSSSSQLNLAESSLFIDAGLPWPLPAGTTIKCIVSAAGRIDDEIWGEIDGVIDLSTASISIEEPAESASKFVAGSLTLNLSDITTTNANASVQITDDNYDSVEWKVSSRQETTPPVPSDARFFTDMKPVVHWLDPGWKDYNIGEPVTVRLAAEHVYGIERIVFTTNGISKSVTTRDGDGYFTHTYVQPLGEAITTATVTPNTAGVPMVMAGNININDAVGDQDGLILGGIRGFVTYGGRTVDEETVSNQAELTDALDSLVGETTPTIINIDTAGVYYLADGNGTERQIPTNGWVIIRGIVDEVQFANQYNKCDVVGQTISNRINNSYTYEFQALGFENVEFIQEGRSQLDYGINVSNGDLYFKEQLISLAPDISRNESFNTKLYYKNCVFTGCVEYNPVLAKDVVDEVENGTPIVEYSTPRFLPDPSDPTVEVQIGGAAGVNYELKPNNENRQFDKGEPNFMLPDTPVIDDWIDSNDAKWVINCTADKMGVGSPIRGTQGQYVLVRDIRVRNVADDIITNAACCLDIDIYNFNGGGEPPSPMHSDLWQAYTNLPATDGKVFGNILLKNITCWMAWEADGDAKIGAGQAIFCDGNWGGGVDGFVVMDCEIACSVATVKLEFIPEEQTIKNMVFSDSTLLRAGERWSGPSNDDPNPSYGDVLFRNCKNGKSTDAPIYVPGNNVTSPEFDDNPLSDWRADGTPIPYWSPYNVHILGEGDEFASEQGDGIPEGSRSILLDGWDADLNVTETVISVPDGTVVFRAPYDIPNDTFMGVAGGAKIGLDDSDRLAFTFDVSSQLSAWINDFNGNTEGLDGFDGIKITDETTNESWNFLIDDLGDNSFTVDGPGGSENATYARLLKNVSDEGPSLQSVLQNNEGPFTVGSVPRSSASRLPNIRSFTQLQLPAYDNNESVRRGPATEDFCVMLSGSVYLNPAGTPLVDHPLSDYENVSIGQHLARINNVMSDDERKDLIPESTRLNPDTAYKGYVAYDLEQPAGFVQALTERPLKAHWAQENGGGDPPESDDMYATISSYNDLNAAGKEEAQRLIKILGRTLIAQHIHYPHAKLAIYGLGWTQPTGVRDSTSSTSGTYGLRKDMFKEVLNYQESHGGASYTVKNIIDLALVKQYAGTGFYKFSYPNAFNSSQHNSTSFMNGVRESFRWMMPELLRETGQDDPDGNHIKVAVLSSTTIEGENESLVYDHMQPNRNGNGDPDWDEDNSNNRAKDEPYRFTVMQHQQAVQSWEEAEMHRNLIEKPCIWGDPSSTDNPYYQYEAILSQDQAMTDYMDQKDDIRIIKDDNGGSTPP